MGKQFAKNMFVLAYNINSEKVSLISSVLVFKFQVYLREIQEVAIFF